MAKIFRTESLSVNGDNIRLTSDSTDTYKLTTSGGATIMNKTNADIDSDVSSLAAVDTELDSDVSSLSKKRTDDVSSLAASISTNDVKVVSAPLVVGDGSSKTVSFASSFASTPTVVGMMQANNATDPIIACQLSGATTENATFIFSDDIPNGNYTLKVLASV